MATEAVGARSDRALLEQAEIVAAAKAAPSGAESRPWRVLVVVLGLCFAAYVFWGRSKAPDSTSNVPFTRQVLVDPDLVGMSTNAGDLVALSGPPPATVMPSPDAAAAEIRNDTRERSDERPKARSRRNVEPVEQPQTVYVPRPPPRLSEATAADADMVTIPLNADEKVIPAIRATPNTVTVGTRILVRITSRVVTGGDAAPVSATLLEDVLVEGQVALASGTRLEGAAYATTGDDRVRVVFNALIADGRTLSVAALALSEANEIGLSGRVLRKGTSGRKGGGALAGLAGTAAYFGAGAIGDGITNQIAREAGSKAARELRGIESELSVSNKEIELAAGTRAIVYVRSDIVIP